MQNPMQDHSSPFLLVLFGSLLGSLAALGATWYFREEISTLVIELTQQFEDIDELRAALNSPAVSEEEPDGSGVTLRTIIQPHPSDEIIFELRPQLKTRFRHVDIATNSFGMRDAETPLAKPEHTFRLAVLGDSYAFGWGISQGEGFPDHLERALQKTHPFEVLNFGTPGYSTFQEVAQFQEKGLAFSPDAVLVYFIHNDFALPFFIRDLRTAEPSTLATAFDFSRMKVPPTDPAAQERRANLLKALDANRALLTLANLCQERSIKLFLTVHPDHREAGVWQKLWVLKNAPGRELIQPIRLADSITQLRATIPVDESALRLPSDSHPGPEMHRLVGLALAQELAPKL